MFLVHHLDFACVISIFASLVLPVMRLYETHNDQQMLAREESITTSELLVPCDRTVRNTEICKFFFPKLENIYNKKGWEHRYKVTAFGVDGSLVPEK